MNKKTTWLIIVLVVVAVAAYLSFRPVSKNKLPAGLVASGHPEWPPIMYQQGDKIVGAGPEIVAKVFGDLGVKVDSKYEGPWDTVQSKAKDGTVDVLVAAYKTAERETYMDYSVPYTVDPVVLVTKKGKSFSYDKRDDLVGKKGVVTTGDSYGQDFDNFLKDKLTVQQVGTPAEAFALLENGKADYFVYALYSAENYFFQQKVADQFEILPKYVSSENFYLTISKKSPFGSLLPQVNALLEKYKSDGTVDRIIENSKQSLWNEKK